MQIKIKLIGIFVCCLLALNIAYALDKPQQQSDPFDVYQEKESILSFTSEKSYLLPDIDISSSPLSIMGSSCSNLYSTTGEYCSGHVRIYYQCLQTVEGSEWQQRNENCEDYSGRCIEEDGQAKCVDGYGQTSYGKKILWTGILLIVVGAAFCILVFMGIIHPFFVFLGALLVYLGVTMLIKFFVGGV
ncbi:hypothetical protein ACFL43_03915 [Thermodesulfobacteriota bacterium]